MRHISDMDHMLDTPSLWTTNGQGSFLGQQDKEGPMIFGKSHSPGPRSKGQGGKFVAALRLDHGHFTALRLGDEKLPEFGIVSQMATHTAQILARQSQAGFEVDPGDLPQR